MSAATRKSSLARKQGRILPLSLLRAYYGPGTYDIKFIKKYMRDNFCISHHPLDKNALGAVFPDKNMKISPCQRYGRRTATGSSKEGKPTFAILLDSNQFKHYQLHPRRKSQNVHQARQQVQEIKIQLPIPFLSELQDQILWFSWALFG